MAYKVLSLERKEVKTLKKQKINSDRNCQHCLFFRDIQIGQAGIITGTCLIDQEKDHTIYKGTTCKDFRVNPKNPPPRFKPTEEQKEAIRYLRRRYSKRGPRPLSLKRGKQYPNPQIKSPLRELLDRLFKLPRRSSGEGRKIRAQLRKLGFYLSKKS